MPEYTGFPNFRPSPPFLKDSLPPNWKSPWHHRDLWRDHPYFSRWNRLKKAIPGILPGAFAFGVYMCYVYWNNTEGPQSVENNRLEKFMHEREHRLVEKGIHIPKHH